jgi:hypothetical protein
MGFTFIEQEISEEKDASWPVIIGTRGDPQYTEVLRPIKDHDTQVI